MVAAAFLTGCERTVQPPVNEMSSYLRLLRAYESSRVFSSVETVSPTKKVVRFVDGYSVDVPVEEFEIHDCREEAPLKVHQEGVWWKVGSTTLPYRVETYLTNSDASPVYVYFDERTLYMYLSNKKVLTFSSYYDTPGTATNGRAIPVIKIVTDGSAAILDKKNYVPGTITIQNPDSMYCDVTTFYARMGIRGRGNSTWGFPKKPWKGKLNEKASLLGMPADKEWALLANYADRTLLRNITAMHLSEICGFSWTPRMRSVEVYLNDKYQGVYTLCEHKKISADRVNIDLVSSDDNSGEAVTGGYYLEIDEQQDGTTCWWTSMGVPMVFSDPEEPTEQQYEYVASLFESFEQALQAEDWSEETGYPKYIDVDSFVDYYIVQELTKNIDGNLRRSSFITKERGGKLEMYHLWDFDLTLGNCGYFWGDAGNGPENFWIKLDKWYPYLFSDPAFVSKVKTRWNELMPEFEKIPQFIDEQALMINDARIRNFRRWSISESVDWVKAPSLGSYKKELDYLKEFYTQRLNWLNTMLNQL